MLDDAIYDQFEEKFCGELNLMANIYYFEGHELLTPSIRHSMDGETDFLIHKMRINSNGIDFIRDDGGLGAV